MADEDVSMKSRFYTFSSLYFMLLVVIIGLSLYAIFDYIRLGKTVKTLLAHNSANVKAATNMLKSVGEQESAQVLLLNHYDDRVVGSYKMCRDQFLNYYKIANRGCAVPRECGILDTIMITYRMYLSLSETFIQASRINHSRRQAAFMDMLATEEQLRALCLRLLDYNQTRIEETNLRIRETANRGALLAVLSATALATVLIIGLNVQLRREVIRPTQRLGQTLRLIRSGNLAPKIDISASGELAELYAEFNKMTERLRAYERLNIQQIIAEKRKAEAVVESLDEPVIVTNSRGVLILMNHAAVNLLRIGDMNWQGKSVKTVVRNKKLRTLLSENSSGESAQTDFWIPIERDSGIQYFRPHRTTAAEDNGRIRYRVTWFQDVTAYHKLDKMKSDFIATVSHEFRTPLTSIHMSIDILAKEVLGQINSKQKELLESAKEDARRLSKLVKDLLDLSKLESGRYRPKREWVDIHSLTQETLRSLDLVLKEKRIDLCFDVSAGLPLIWGDSQQLSWAMANLVSNAIRHTPEQGTVTIEMNKVHDTVHVTVSDTGRGISEKDIDVIFEKFVQIKEPTESTPGSVGLGLAITKEAIEAHGGTIGVTSKIGKGSTFFFTLPLRKNETA
jgi:signal transduction histidine kinase